MLNVFLRTGLVLLFFLPFQDVYAKPSSDFKELSARSAHREASREIVRLLEREHYASRKVDDELAADLLVRYFDYLDPNRLLLLRSDLAMFQRNSARLDDEIRRGDLGTGYAVYNLFRERYRARLNWIIDLLPDMVANFDFEREESLALDRSELPRPATQSEADELWRKQLKNRVLSLRLTEKPEDEILELLMKRYKNNLHRLGQTDEEDVFQFFMNSLGSLYDPHTDYFSPRLSENFQINMSLKLEGIGAVLEYKDEYTTVVRLVPAGPADKQGELQPADRITGVAQGDDGEIQDVIGWRLDDVVDLIRGPKGSVVRLEVLPANAKTDAEQKIIRIERNEVKLEEQSAQKEMLEYKRDGKTRKVGVISVPTFYLDFEALRRRDPDFRSTTRDVKRLLDELIADGAEGIVIDLRNNGGGSLTEANNMTGLFIEAGPTVQIRHANGRVTRQGKRRRSNYYQGPVVVLVNRLSASASEIFAGALQDYQRAIVVGTQSFGKGTVQSITGLQHGQLKLTESKFYRISGASTQHRGVIPDILFPAVYNAEKVGESALDDALPWDTIAPIIHRRYHDFSEILPSLRSRHQDRAKSIPDFVFLEEQVAQIEKLSEIDSLSLNEETRRQQREEERALLLEIENRRRVGNGEEPLESLDEEEEDEDKADSEDESAKKDEDDKDEKPDPLLRAAGAILLDAEPAFKSKQSNNLLLSPLGR